MAVSTTQNINPSAGTNLSGLNLTNLAAPTTTTTNTLQAGTSDGSTAGDVGNLLQMFGSLYGLYGSTQLNNSAQQVLAQSNPFGSSRPTYVNQLNALMANPSSVTSTPGYQFQLGQGVQAIDRSALAPGGTGAGGAELAALDTFGQGLASSFYQTDLNNLMQLSGANFPPANPAQALAGVGGAQGSLGSSISGVANSLPGAVKSLSNLFNGAPSTLGGGLTGDPSLYSGLTDSSGVPYFLSNDPALSYAGGATDAGGVGDMLSAGSGLNEGDTLGDLFGFSPAGGEAATTGAVGEGTVLAAPEAGAATAATGGVDTMSLAETGSASLGGVPGSLATTDTTAGSAGGAAAGSLGLGLAGVGAVLGVAAYGASQPGVELNSQWYQNGANTVGAGLSQNASVEQKIQAATMLNTIGMLQQGSSGLSTDNNYSVQRALQSLAPYGITSIAQAQQIALSLLNSIPPGAMPGQGATPGGGTTVGAGNMFDTSKPF